MRILCLTLTERYLLHGEYQGQLIEVGIAADGNLGSPVLSLESSQLFRYQSKPNNLFCSEIDLFSHPT